ncbi:MAG: hypothetical protein HY541_04550 [Deltaproteobacteria bacterium]|nr:hypothetical protein [Deltaproteobacteria bacterium]
MQRLLTYLLGVFFFLAILSYFFKGGWPDRSEINPLLLKNPVQFGVKGLDFSFEYRGSAYKVQPVAGYELWGLVVTHNNIHSFFDISHNRNSVDTKDLCVMWGRNLTTKDYGKMKFSSGDWTCYAEWSGCYFGSCFSASPEFFHNEFSNNHLITSNEEVRDKINSVKIGDQIHLKGYLVNYTYPGGVVRKSSLSRNDNGCEVIFVQELEILKRFTPFWYALYSISAGLFFFTLLAKIVLGYFRDVREG